MEPTTISESDKSLKYYVVHYSMNFSISIEECADYESAVAFVELIEKYGYYTHKIIRGELIAYVEEDGGHYENRVVSGESIDTNA